MKKINYLSFFILILITLTNSNRLNAEIIILSSCNNQKDGFLKNEYTLDLEKLLMTRNYVYKEKTFKKYRFLTIFRTTPLISVFFSRFLYLSNRGHFKSKGFYQEKRPFFQLLSVFDHVATTSL